MTTATKAKISKVDSLITGFAQLLANLKLRMGAKGLSYDAVFKKAPSKRLPPTLQQCTDTLILAVQLECDNHPDSSIDHCADVALYIQCRDCTKKADETYVPDGDGTEGSPCKTCTFWNYDGRSVYVYAGRTTTVMTYLNHFFEITTNDAHRSNGGTVLPGQTVTTIGTAPGTPVTTFTVPEELTCQTLWYWCGAHVEMTGGRLFVMPTDGSPCPTPAPAEPTATVGIPGPITDGNPLTMTYRKSSTGPASADGFKGYLGNKILIGSDVVSIGTPATYDDYEIHTGTVNLAQDIAGRVAVYDWNEGPPADGAGAWGPKCGMTFITYMAQKAGAIGLLMLGNPKDGLFTDLKME